MTTAQSQSAKKRKRAPSPDVIPNPPGCSYGLDLDYFYYSDESDEEADGASQTEISPSKNASAAPKSAIRNATSSQLPPSKKVRFDASPQDSPSKTRRLPCATDPYTGRHFLGIGEQPLTPPTDNGISTHQTAAAPPGLGFSPGSPQSPIAALRSDTDISQGTSRSPVADSRSDTVPSRATTSPAPIAAAHPDSIPGPPATVRPDPSLSHATTSSEPIDAPRSDTVPSHATASPGPIAGPRPDSARLSAPSSAAPQLTQSTAQSPISSSGAATGLMRYIFLNSCISPYNSWLTDFACLLTAIVLLHLTLHLVQLLVVSLTLSLHKLRAKMTMEPLQKSVLKWRNSNRKPQVVSVLRADIRALSQSRLTHL